jgi:hypothetical protein
MKSLLCWLDNTESAVFFPISDVFCSGLLLLFGCLKWMSSGRLVFLAESVLGMLLSLLVVDAT